MAVVPFKRARRGRRISLRRYIRTEAGLFRLSSRLARELAHGDVAVPQFANSTQRLVEVFVETAGDQINDIQFRATHARFGPDGKADLRYAAETITLILDGSVPQKIDQNVWDITPTLKTKKRDRETRWRVTPSLKRLIVADITGKAKLPILRVT